MILADPFSERDTVGEKHSVLLGYLVAGHSTCHERSMCIIHKNRMS